MDKIVQVVTFSDKKFKTYSSFTKSINKFLEKLPSDDIVNVSFSNETSDAHGICMIAYKVSRENLIMIRKFYNKIKTEDEDEQEENEEDDTEKEDDEESESEPLVKIS